MDQYDTQLSPEDELAYAETYGPNDSADYDMRGYFLANKGVEHKEGDHFPDTYKKPNHMTFSDESIYHGKDGNQGGSWRLLPDGNFAFRPGATNFQHHSTEDMVNYFKKVEPGNYLLLGGE